MTKHQMYLKMLFNSLTRRRSRMTAALLAVVVGAAVFQGMMTICYDVPRQMEREFRSYGANMLLVAEGDGAMSLEDAGRAAALLPGDKLVGATPYRYKPARANMQPVTAVGTRFDQVKKTSPWWRLEGTWPEGNQLLVGANVAEFMALSPGKVIALSGRSARGTRFSREMMVSGVVSTGGPEEDFVFMDLTVLEELDGNPGTADLLEVSVACGAEELAELAESIRKEVPALAPRLVKRVTSAETSVLTRLRTLMYLVTLVVLALTMICVATTMMTVVLERRKEIGLKKALGAENFSIVAEFLGEGVCLGVAGSLPGVALGWICARAIGLNVFGRVIGFSLPLAPATVFVSIALTAAASLLPIRAAVDVEPAIVLRGE
jgi:putative ABC transport system permease protein